MSNHWIEWTCVDCERRVFLQWIVEPGWPSGIVHHRTSWCEACFEKILEPPFVVTEAVTEALHIMRARLCEDVFAHVDAMTGRPKERFLELGLDEKSARAAAEAFSLAKGASGARRKSRRDEELKHRDAMVSACLQHVDFPLLTAKDRELIRALAGPHVIVEDTSQFRPSRRYSRAPQEQEPSDRDLVPPLVGEHGRFYVATEQFTIRLPG